MGKHRVPCLLFPSALDAQFGTPYPRSTGFDTDRHHTGDRTAHKVLQSGFYWPTLFKDARKFVLSCDECQRIGNISRRQEMPMNYSLVIEPFDVWALIIWDLFLPLMGIHIF